MYRTAILLMSSLFALSISQDPCIVHQLISEPRRSPNYVPGIGEALICDRSLQDGWYRFHDDGMMPEKCIDRYHCGTHDPVWFMGKHPTKQGQEVTGKACANTGFGANCCGYEIGTISVRHCGAFFVYKLLRIQGCSFAYCAGKGDPCPYGMSSLTGYQPGCAASFPMMAGNPILLGPFKSGICPNNSGLYTDFYFTCKVNYSDPLDRNVAFEITWLIDGKEHTKTNIKGLERSANIATDQLDGQMGHELSCAVRSYFLNSLNTSSPSYNSTNHYRMEIKFEPGRLDLEEKKRTSTEVKVVSTVPIPCSSCTDPKETCVYEVHLKGSNATGGECSIKLSYSDWDDTKKSAITNTTVLADKDVFNLNKTAYLVPELYPSAGVNHMLQTYVLQRLPINVTNNPAPVCTCFGDPHILTFDRYNAGMGKNGWSDVGYYDMYKVGMFTMVQTKPVLPNMPDFQVEIQTHTCSNVSCVCGVVAREGTDVVSINICENRFEGPRVDERILSPKQFSNFTIIHEKDNSYIIYFPSGRMVKAYKDQHNVGCVEVQIRPDDAGNVEGLCGEFNGHPDVLGYNANRNPVTYTRQPKDFIESKRIPFGASMYDKGDANYTSHDNYTQECKCNNDYKGWQMVCKSDAGLQQHASSFSTRMPNYTDVTQQILHRSLALPQKQSTQPLYTFSQYSKDLAFVPIQRTWPTVGGLYEADAKRICQEAINKHDALRKCHLEANVNFAGIINMCVEDIKVTGDVAMIDTAVNTAMSMCVEFVVKNPAVFPPGKSTTLNLLMNRPCIGDCSGNGNCTQGTCICKYGFDGEDCSVDKTKQPVIQWIVSGDQCDLQLGPCRPIYMSVSNFYHTTESRCHLLEKKETRLAEFQFNGRFIQVEHHLHSVHSFSNGNFVETGYRFHSAAAYVTSKDVSCLIPSQTDVQGKSILAYAVSVTSDGTLHSPQKTIVIYDSACMTCDANSNCAIKPQTCMIDGNCWVANTVKHDDQTYRCDPLVNNTAWTHAGHIPTRADIWTRTQSGCVCNFNTVQMDCACCDEGAVQCPFGTHHQCVQSGSLSSCGTLMPAPLYGIDGYTRSLTGCLCDHNKSLHDCACCQNGGVQCGSHFRNQCVQFGHLDQCGQKQYIFGP